MTSQHPRRRLSWDDGPFPLHVLLAPAVPVLALWSANASRTSALVLPVQIGAWSIVAAGTITLIVSIPQRDVRRSAAIAVLWLLWLQWCGPLVPSGGLLLPTLLGPPIALSAAVAALPTRSMRPLTIIMNAMAVALVTANLGLVALERPNSTMASPPDAIRELAPAAESAPDIWWIIPDRYASPTSLAGMGIDIDEFVGSLREGGFRVLQDASTNYPETVLALGAAFALRHLDRDAPFDDAYDVLRDPPVGRLARQAGYEYIHVGAWTEATASAESADRVLTLSGSSEFWHAWEANTAIPALSRLGLGAPQPINFRRHVEHARHQLATLQQLADESRGRPRFVLAHLLLPHEPYVFDAHGAVKSTDSVINTPTAYAEQASYLNGQLLQLVESLQQIEPEPLILLLADEGPYPADLGAAAGDGFPQLTPQQEAVKFSILAAVAGAGADGLRTDATLLEVVESTVARSLLGAGADIGAADVAYTWSDPGRSELVRRGR